MEEKSLLARYEKTDHLLHPNPPQPPTHPQPPLHSTPATVDFHNSGKADNVGDVGFGSPDSFVSEWEKLTKDLMAMPNVPGKLMIDIMNEPDAYNIRVRDLEPCMCF